MSFEYQRRSYCPDVLWYRLYRFSSSPPVKFHLLLSCILFPACLADVGNETWDSVDTDGDMLSDEWEIYHFQSIYSQNGKGDPDSDGESNLEEFQAGTNPNRPDTKSLSVQAP